MNKPWFDEQTGHILFDEYVTEMPTFQAITRDKIVTEEELAEQAMRVISLLRRLESELQPAVKDLATEVFSELAVLHSLHAKFQESSWRH
jgi:GTPase